MQLAVQPSKRKTRRPAAKDFTLNKVKLIRAGRKYFTLLKELIDSATDTIHLQVYIYDDDETGRAIADALINAAQRDVKVYLLVDGYASQDLPDSLIGRLRNGGVHFRFFEPLFKSRYFYFGRRLHHKLLVVDAKYALVGGINISNKYNDEEGHPAWLDFALYAEGAIAKELCVLCHKTWKGFPRNMGSTPCEKNKVGAQLSTDDGSYVRMRRNDWVRGKKQISTSYIAMLRNARKQVTILCSYFLPGHEIREHLLKAAQRGVKIKVIMAGSSDVRIAKQAERYIYKDLLENNIEIYEYQKSVLHGKITICDDEWLTIGSYNVNNISAYASIELNLDVYDPVFAKKVNNKLLEIAEHDCIQITRQWVSRTENPLVRLVQWFSYEIIRFLFYVFTFYFRQRT